MDKRSMPENEKKDKSAIKNVIIFVLMAILLISGVTGITYAKFISSGSSSGFSQAASWGRIELKEHEVVYIDGKYELTDKEILITNGKSNNYSNIGPNMVIPKDPFIVVIGNFEVTYGIFVKVTEVNFPMTVTYGLGTDWELVTKLSSGNSKTYQYKGDVKSNNPIYILKDNKLTFEKEFAGGVDFSITFFAWIEQIS